MIITEAPGFKAALLKKIADREFAQRTGVHQSDLNYCLNKQAMRRLFPLPTEEHELLLFSLGFAIQRWLTGSPTDEPEIEMDGIKVTLDAIDVYPWEIKCTFQSGDKPIAENQHWIRQVMAQCYVSGNAVAYLSRLEVMGDWKMVFKPKGFKDLPLEERQAYEKAHPRPTLHAFKFEFTADELESNWAWLKGRRDLFLGLLAGAPLLPKTQALPPDQTWECNYCNPIYKQKCEEAQ